MKMKRGMEHGRLERFEGYETLPRSGGPHAHCRMLSDCGWSAAAVSLYSLLGLDRASGGSADCPGLSAAAAGKWKEVKRMAIRLVCVKAPKPVGKLLRAMVGRRKKSA